MGLSRRQFFKVSAAAPVTTVDGVLACAAPSSNGMGQSEGSSRLPACHVVQESRRSAGAITSERAATSRTDERT
ncbi:MAG: hypothetical protein OJF51_000642 [Nitrospira sp.]|jgi:hypothetical protein|nr:MAG: hypothetical protein OJF51_000642 [Nitrospira sp.]